MAQIAVMEEMIKEGACRVCRVMSLNLFPKARSPQIECT